MTEVEAFDSADGWRRQFRNYDPQGRLRHVSRPFFSTATAAACWRSADCTVHHYGSADDQAESRIVRPDGGSLETVRSAVEGTATVDATVLIRREGTTAVERRTKRTTFNAAGEVVGTVDGHGTAKAVTTSYRYDAQGNLSRVAVAGVEVARTTYDEAGNRTEIDDPSLGRWTFEHDALSQLKRRVDAEGNETRYRHDALGRTTGRDECYAPCRDRATSTWTYDPANATGALASRSGGGLTQTYRYRADGRPDRVDTRIAVPFALTESYAQTFAYDAAGRPSSVDHAGTAFARDYNARGYLREVRHGATVLHEYRGTDAYGSSAEERLGGGALATTRGYDPGTGRLRSIATGRSSETGTPKGIQDLVYRWRTDGGLHRRTDARGTAAAADDLTDTFSTDALGRVVRQATTGASTRRKDYAYDAFGNLSSKTSRTEGDMDVALSPRTDMTGPYRLSSATLGAATARFTYDDSGNTVHYALAAGSTTVQYDAGNRVRRIDAGGRGGPSDEFWHGPDGARFLRRETWTESGAARTRLTVHLGAFEEARPSHGDFAKVRRIRATDGAVRVEKTARAGSEAMDSSSFAYLHRDHLGSVDRVTDGSGAASGVGATSFDPLGSHRRADRSADLDAAGREALLAAEDVRSPRGFTDHEHLSRTGFVHMNGRVYDPRLGRFLSPDPVVANPFHSQSWNRYAYVTNRPLSFTDPTGNYMSGSYYGLTADDFNVVDINAMMMADLWDYVSWSGSGVRFYQLSTLDSVLTRGLTNSELDEYLATGRDPRRTALKAAGEFLFPEDGSQDLEDYAGVIATNGVRGDRAELQDLANEKGVPVYFNRSHGLLFDLLQALSQRMSPRTDGLARGLALALREAGWNGKLLAHSQGTLTVVNAVRHFGLGATGAELRSPATSYRGARRAFGVGKFNYVQPWGDAANVWAPSANPFRWASGFYDLLCGFCVHRANGLEAALEAGP